MSQLYLKGIKLCAIRAWLHLMPNIGQRQIFAEVKGIEKRSVHKIAIISSLAKLFFGYMFRYSNGLQNHKKVRAYFPLSQLTSTHFNFERINALIPQAMSSSLLNAIDYFANDTVKVKLSTILQYNISDLSWPHCL